MKFDTIKRILISIACVSTLVAAPVTVTYDDEEQVLVDPEKIPISTNVDVKIPTVNVPTVNTPSVDARTLAITKISSFPESYYLSAETVQLSNYDTVIYDAATNKSYLVNVKTGSVTEMSVAIPYATGSTVGLPSVYTNSVETPSVSWSSVWMPSVYTGAIGLPSVGSYNGQYGAIKLIDVKTGETRVITGSGAYVKLVSVDGASVDVPVVTDIEPAVAAWVQLMKDLKELVHDQRMIQYDKSLSIKNQALLKWIQLYKEGVNYRMEYIPVNRRTRIRMIAEARVPKNTTELNTLKSNLEFYKREGYNSVLVAFYMTESPYAVKELVNLIKGYGFDVYISYSGEESLTTSVFKDPDDLADMFAQIAPLAKGMLLGWRKTSLHLFIQDATFSNYIIRCARSANPNIEVFGEAYYGQTADSNGSYRNVAFNVPNNETGCIVAGIGFANTNIEGATNRFFPDISTQTRLGVVVGDTPYYGSTRDNKLGFDLNFKIKVQIENAFGLAGYNGTITLHGDGGPGKCNDNMSETPCK